MTITEKTFMWIVIFLLGGLVIYSIGVSQGWWRDFFKPKPTPVPEPEKTPYEKCVEINKSLADGEPCGNCIPEGSTIPSYKGIIKDRKCEPIGAPTPKPIVYAVKTQGGATIYQLIQGNFVAPRIPQKVPFQTQIQIVAISPKRDYVNASGFGWLSVNDIAQIQVS